MPGRPDLVGHGDGAHELGAAPPAVLRGREQWGDVVTRMRVLGREKSVVEVKLAHRDAIGPCGPLRRHASPRAAAEQHRSRGEWPGERLRPGMRHWRPAERGRGDGCVVDQPVDHHRRDVAINPRSISRELGELPGELIALCQALSACVHPHEMFDQVPPFSCRAAR